MSYCSSIKKGGTVNEWVDDKMNHLERYWQEGLATKVIPHMRDDDSLLLLTSFHSGTRQPREIRLCQQTYQESLIILPSWVHVCVWVFLMFLCSCRLPMMMAMVSGGAQLSSRVAHGKVCTGARTLSVWVKAMYTFGLGTALCWVTSLHDIWLTETNARGVSVKNGTKGNVLST